MQRIHVLSLAATMIGASAHAQVNYDDVAVIANMNDPVSVYIANYFMAERSIPEVNLILVDAPVSPSVDSMGFEDLRAQIEDHLINNQLVDAVNYLVCIKGVPHRVELVSCTDQSPNGCSSVDSELSMILGPYAENILEEGVVQDPFVNSTQHQDHAQTGIYLVTRLDGFTQQDVIELIDRSGPAMTVVKPASVILADISHAPPPMNQLSIAITSNFEPLADNGWNVVVDSMQAPVEDLQNVVAFLSIDPQPDQGAFPNTWSEGAIASEVYSFGAFAFDASDPVPNHTRVAYLVQQGATGVRGSVTTSFANPSLQMSTTVERYLGDPGLNLAESFWAGLPFVSYGDLVIGDPKAAVVVDLTNSVTDQHDDRLLIWYDAFANTVNFSVPDGAAGTYTVDVLDPLGRPVIHTNAKAKDPIDVSGIAAGAYVLRVTDQQRTIGARSFVKPH